MHPDNIRTALLSEVAGRAGEANLQPATVLNAVARKLGIPDAGSDAKYLLTAWSDLFRGGYVSWGYNLSNIDPPFYHVTEKGSRMIATLSRDPSNPAGYLNYLSSKAPVNDVAQSYVAEALGTYNSGFYRAAAVMIGVAAESLVLEVRDELKAKVISLGEKPSPKLVTWQIRSVLGAIEDVLGPKTKSMSAGLRESFEAYWPAFTQQIRAARNEAGHPVSVAPISEEVVHATFLIFPELARLTSALSSWIREEYG